MSEIFQNKFIPNFSLALNQDCFLRNPEIVARELIGKALVKIESNGEVFAGMITETEAYLSEGDLSSHSACGLTKRNAPMFADGGILYVYKIYGVHHCINFVTESQDIGSAVLIRAIEPLSGIEIMKERREIDKINKLCNGPGNIAKAFNLTQDDNYKSLYTETLFVQEYLNIPDEKIAITARIGISKSKDLPLRFLLKSK